MVSSIWGRGREKRATGKIVRNPTIKERLVKKIGESSRLKRTLPITAVATPFSHEANTKRFPVRPTYPSPFLRIGPRIITTVPASAIPMPSISRLVTFSCKNHTPAIATIIGPAAEIKVPYSAVVFSYPKNKNPKVTVEVRKE